MNLLYRLCATSINSTTVCYSGEMYLVFNWVLKEFNLCSKKFISQKDAEHRYPILWNNRLKVKKKKSPSLIPSRYRRLNSEKAAPLLPVLYLLWEYFHLQTAALT